MNICFLSNLTIYSIRTNSEACILEVVVEDVHVEADKPVFGNFHHVTLRLWLGVGEGIGPVLGELEVLGNSADGVPLENIEGKFNKLKYTKTNTCFYLK